MIRHQASKFVHSMLVVFLLCAHDPAAAQVPTAAQLITLTPAAREALDNGVKLEFECDYASTNKVWLLTHRVLKRQHRFDIQRHALSQRYVVRRDDLDAPRIFHSSSQAMEHVANQALGLLQYYRNEANVSQMRVHLDPYALPGPMRLSAFLSEEWELDSDWLVLQP